MAAGGKKTIQGFHFSQIGSLSDDFEGFELLFGQGQCQGQSIESASASVLIAVRYFYARFISWFVDFLNSLGISIK